MKAPMALIGNDLAGWVQVVLEVIAIVLVVLFYLFDYRRGKSRAEEERKKERESRSILKKAILSALKREIEMNWRYVHNSPPPEVYHANYYDPSRQTFKVCRDDAIMRALSMVESDVLSDPDLAQSLLAVSQAVRFVNQQIDELMAFRFGSPQLLSMASTFAKTNHKVLAEVASDEGKIQTMIPITLRAWFRELSQRNWAIVNEGYWNRLLLTLVVAKPHLDKAVEEIGLEPLEMPDLEKVLGMLASLATQAVSTSGSPFPR